MILCCGEALIDMVPDDDGCFAPLAGGALLNSAIGIGRQGVEVGLISGVSTDMFGSHLCNILEESKVSTQHLIRSALPTTLAFVTLVDGQAQYAFYDENTAGKMLAPQQMPAALPPASKAMLFGGISLAVEPCADAYEALLNQHAKDVLVMVDPNIRPSFIKDEMRYRGRLNGILQQADIVKISDEDLHWLTPDAVDIESKINGILDLGVKLVCLTQGAKAVKLFSSDGLLAQVTPPKVEVVDTVGAGDTFNAGFLAHLSRAGCLQKAGVENLPIPILTDALTFAAALAADNATRKGANPAWNFKL